MKDCLENVTFPIGKNKAIGKKKKAKKCEDVSSKILTSPQHRTAGISEENGENHIANFETKSKIQLKDIQILTGVYLNIIENKDVYFCPPTGSGTAPFIKDGSKPLKFKDRIDKAVDWLETSKNVTFVAIYLEEPDQTTHEHGPDSNHTSSKNFFKTALSKVDLAIGELVDKLNKTKLLNETNIIFIGDHGSINTTHEKVIDLDKYVDSKKTIRYVIGFTYTSVWPNNGYLKEIYLKLKNKHPHLKVYLKEDLPENFHIKHHNRTAPLLLFPDPGWVLKTKKEKVPYLKDDFSRGEHGYTNLCLKMNPGFVAFGPVFKKGFHKETIEIVDLYPLICHILGINPLRNDGKLDRTLDFLLKS